MSDTPNLPVPTEKKLPNLFTDHGPNWPVLVPAWLELSLDKEHFPDLEEDHLRMMFSPLPRGLFARYQAGGAGMVEYLPHPAALMLLNLFFRGVWSEERVGDPRVTTKTLRVKQKISQAMPKALGPAASAPSEERDVQEFTVTLKIRGKLPSGEWIERVATGTDDYDPTNNNERAGWAIEGAVSRARSKIVLNLVGTDYYYRRDEEKRKEKERRSQ